MSMRDFILAMSILQPKAQEFLGEAILLLVYKTLILA